VSDDSRQQRVTISLPTGTLACVDFIAAQLRQSRSATIDCGLQYLLDRHTIHPAAKPESAPDASC